MPNVLSALFCLVLLHAPGGAEVGINSAAVTSLRGSRGDYAPDKMFPRGAHCAIGLSDGKLAAVVESCAEIRMLIARECLRQAPAVPSAP